MNHYFHHIGARRAFAVTAAVATLALAGCGKPPACGDDNTLGLLRSIVIDNVQKGLNTFEKDDPSGILAEFKRSIKITFSQIVSEGYKEDAKKQMCSAQLRFQDMSKEGDEVRIEYSSQLTEDKCVFRPIVTARSGNVTGDFGIVTGRSGAVTGEIWRE